MGFSAPDSAGFQADVGGPTGVQSGRSSQAGGIGWDGRRKHRRWRMLSWRIDGSENGGGMVAGKSHRPDERLSDQLLTVLTILMSVLLFVVAPLQAFSLD
jgi:hypothetical protein